MRPVSRYEYVLQQVHAGSAVCVGSMASYFYRLCIVASTSLSYAAMIHRLSSSTASSGACDTDHVLHALIVSITGPYAHDCGRGVANRPVIFEIFGRTCLGGYIGIPRIRLTACTWAPE